MLVFFFFAILYQKASIVTNRYAEELQLKIKRMWGEALEADKKPVIKKLLHLVLKLLSWNKVNTSYTLNMMT